MADQPTLRKYVPGLVWYRPFEPFAYATVRVGTGVVLLLHGAQRLFYGASTQELGALAGLPATTVGGFELVGGAALALGLLTRPLALLFAIEWLAVAMAAHLPAGKSWLSLGATEHFPAFIVGLCLIILIRGGGQHSLDRHLPKEI